MSEIDYLAMAREQIALDDAAAAENRIESRAAAMRESDERAAQLRSLADEHGLPGDASPRQISDAMNKREREFWSGFLSMPGWQARYASLCNELGLPDTTERSAVWQAMRETGHRLVRAVRNPATGAFAEGGAA